MDVFRIRAAKRLNAAVGFVFDGAVVFISLVTAAKPVFIIVIRAACGRNCGVFGRGIVYRKVYIGICGYILVIPAVVVEVHVAVYGVIGFITAVSLNLEHVGNDNGHAYRFRSMLCARRGVEQSYFSILCDFCARGGRPRCSALCGIFVLWVGVVVIAEIPRIVAAGAAFEYARLGSERSAAYRYNRADGVIKTARLLIGRVDYRKVYARLNV